MHLERLGVEASGEFVESHAFECFILHDFSPFELLLLEILVGLLVVRLCIVLLFLCILFELLDFLIQ